MILSQYNELINSVKEKFLQINTPVLIVTHKDCDGVVSSFLLSRLLEKLNIKYKIESLQHLDVNKVHELRDRDDQTIIFTDLGSSHIDLIEENLSEKNIFILDHHFVEGTCNKITMLNPRTLGMTDDYYACAASVVYTFINSFDDFKKYSACTILGIIGDYQAKHDIIGLNEIVINDAIESGLVDVKKDLNIYGKQSKKLHSCLARCDFDIPTIKSQKDSIEFLKKIGIYDGKWVTYNELSDKKKELLKSELIKLRNGNEEGMYSNNITFKTNVLIKDAFEFTTLINSQIRMNKFNLAFDLCTFDNEKIKVAKNEIKNYQDEIKKALAYIDSIEIYESDSVVIINTLNKLRPELISTVSSIISKSRKYRDLTMLFILGRINKYESKISGRVCGLKKQNKVNIKQYLKDRISNLTENIGGHNDAAGAVIHTIDELEVIEKLK